MLKRKGMKKKTVGNQMRENETGLKIRRVYHICFQNPLANELPHSLIYPPFLTIPQACISVEDVATILFRRDAPFVAHRLQKYICIY